MFCDVNEQGVSFKNGIFIPWGKIEIVGRQNKFLPIFSKIGWYGQRWDEYYVQRYSETEKIIVVSTWVDAERLDTGSVFVPLEVSAVAERLIKCAAIQRHIKFEERSVFNRSKPLDVQAELKNLAFRQSDKAKAARADFEKQKPKIFLTIAGLALLIFLTVFVLSEMGFLPKILGK